MVEQNEVYQKVKECLVEALGVDEADIVPGARIMDDLGAESIDFLDIVFRLEKAFGIKIPRGASSPRISSPMTRSSRTEGHPAGPRRTQEAYAVRRSLRFREGPARGQLLESLPWI